MKPSMTMGHIVLTSSTVLFVSLHPISYKRNRINHSKIGPEYIPIAFETAALYDSKVKLYYNDYNIESAGAKSTAAQNLVSSLKARGIKIDGVGLQAHFIVGETPSLSSQISNLEAFTALGVEVAYTELDIRFTSLPPTTAGLTQQGTDYVNTVSACVETTDCVGVTVWDYTDKYSWIPATFSGQGEACLWYADFTLHPAYYSVVSALGGKATAAPTTASATTLVTSKTTSSAKATTTASGTVAKWGQCGGNGWTGGTVCVAGTTCTYSNPWYSQCL
jgi:endo-1,4-beta-xylanase